MDINNLSLEDQLFADLEDFVIEPDTTNNDNLLPPISDLQSFLDFTPVPNPVSPYDNSPLPTVDIVVPKIEHDGPISIEKSRKLAEERNIKNTSIPSKPVGDQAKKVRASKGRNPDTDFPIEEGVINTLKVSDKSDSERVADIENIIKQKASIRGGTQSMLLELNQITGLVCTGQNISALSTHFMMRNSYYHSSYGSIHFGLDEPKCALALHVRRGIIVCMGCRTMADVEKAIKVTISIFQQLVDYSTPKNAERTVFHYRKPAVMNITCTYDVGHPIMLTKVGDLELQFFWESRGFSVFTQNDFPSIYIKDTTNRVMVQVFDNGSLSMTLYRIGKHSKLDRDRETNITFNEKYKSDYSGSTTPFSVDAIKFRMYDTLTRLLPLLRMDEFRR